MKPKVKLRYGVELHGGVIMAGGKLYRPNQAPYYFWVKIGTRR